MKCIRPIAELLLLAALLVPQACGKGAEAACLEVSPSILTADALGGQVSFSVRCSEDWMAAADQSWVKLQTVKGSGSDDAVTVKAFVSENEDVQPRTATIRVSSLSGKRQTV